MNSARAALLQGAIDRGFGEEILIEPRAASGGDVNARRVADGERPAITVTGVWVAPQIEFARRPHTRVEGRNRDLSATRPTVKLQANAVPYALAIGDRVTRVATGERAEIAVVAFDGFGRLLLNLTAKS